MADYKIALQLYQSQVGDENAEVKISINGATVAESLEISNTDSENPTLFVYDVADLPAPGEDTTTVIKVELLNDLYVDSNNDRNAYWVGCGYSAKDDDENYYRIRTDPGVYPSGAEMPNRRITEIITDWTDVESFNWAEGSEYQGDENGTVDMTEGWHPFAITSTYVSSTISLTFPEVMVLADE
jgi:hypothetical protein